VELDVAAYFNNITIRAKQGLTLHKV